MTTIFPGRYTAEGPEEFVVFLIGMRINRFWAVHKWLPVARAMVPMLNTLLRDPAKGFLSAEGFFNGRTALLVQYWRSLADLQAFAHNPGDPHLSAWRQFNQNVGDDGSVGIWHETYVVRSGMYECIYGNMPRFGLAKAFTHMPIDRGQERASQRMERGQAV